jgi:hypothetical protein
MALTRSKSGTIKLLDSSPVPQVFKRLGTTPNAKAKLNEALANNDISGMWRKQTIRQADPLADRHGHNTKATPPVAIQAQVFFARENQGGLVAITSGSVVLLPTDHEPSKTQDDINFLATLLVTEDDAPPETQEASKKKKRKKQEPIVPGRINWDLRSQGFLAKNTRNLVVDLGVPYCKTMVAKTLKKCGLRQQTSTTLSPSTRDKNSPGNASTSKWANENNNSATCIQHHRVVERARCPPIPGGNESPHQRRNKRDESQSNETDPHRPT